MRQCLNIEDVEMSYQDKKGDSKGGGDQINIEDIHNDTNVDTEDGTGESDSKHH